MSEKIASVNRPKLVKGRVREAMRLAKNVGSTNQPQVYAYYRYLLTDSRKYINEVSC